VKIYSFTTEVPTVYFLQIMQDIENLKSVKIMKKGHNIHSNNLRPPAMDYYGIMFCVMDEQDRIYLNLRYGNLLKEL